MSHSCESHKRTLKLQHLISQFSFSLLLYFHEYYWPLLSWNSCPGLDVPKSSGSSLTSLFQFWIIFSHLKVDHHPLRALSLAIFSLYSPLAFISAPTPSTISSMLMIPKSLFQTIAWVSVPHFQLPSGVHIHIHAPLAKLNSPPTSTT